MLPGRQSEHTLELLLPGVGLALPGEHWMHDVLLDVPSAGLYVPGGHCVNVWLALAAPTAPQKPPTGQGSHDVDRSSVLKLPAAQGSQVLARAVWLL